jgi:hypothetical protein
MDLPLPRRTLLGRALSLLGGLVGVWGALLHVRTPNG